MSSAQSLSTIKPLPMAVKNIKRELETDDDESDSKIRNKRIKIEKDSSSSTSGCSSTEVYSKVGIKRIKIEKDSSSSTSGCSSLVINPSPITTTTKELVKSGRGQSDLIASKIDKSKGNNKNKNKKEVPVSEASKLVLATWLKPTKLKTPIKKEKPDVESSDSDDIIFLEEIMGNRDTTTNDNAATNTDTVNPVLYPHAKKSKYGDFFERRLYKNGDVRFRCKKCQEQYKTQSKLVTHLKKMHRRDIAFLNVDDKLKNQKLYAKLSSIE